MSYGVSFKLNEDNDITFDPTKNTIMLVKGTDNLEQAIRIILKTALTEIKTFPTFGIDIPQLLNKNISDDNIKHAITGAIIKDPRVKSIDKVNLERVNRTLNVDMWLTAYNGASLDFRESISW